VALLDYTMFCGLIVSAVIALRLWRTLARFEASEAARTEPLRLLGEQSFSFPIAGTDHFQDKLERLIGAQEPGPGGHPCVATLVPDPGSRFDKDAIFIDIEGYPIGFIPRSRTAPFLSILRGQKAQADALILSGAEAGGSSGLKRLCVNLDIAWPPRLTGHQTGFGGPCLPEARSDQPACEPPSWQTPPSTAPGSSLATIQASRREN
jgi:hypothetical protein